MRSSYHCACKFCEAKRDWESHWLPLEVLQSFANIWLTCHALTHHSEKLTKNRIKYTLEQFFWSVVIIILFTLLTIFRIILYPLWWILEKLFY